MERFDSGIVLYLRLRWAEYLIALENINKAEQSIFDNVLISILYNTSTQSQQTLDASVS